MLNNKDLKLLNKVKINAYTLNKNKQIPHYLYTLIINCDKNTDINYFKKLMYMSEDLIRLKWYYKKYPLMEKKAEETIRLQLEK